MRYRVFLFVSLLAQSFVVHGQSTKDFLTMLNDNIVPINEKSLIDSSQITTDNPLDLGRFRVLAIGEQSHGTSEFFKTRTALLKKLATEHTLTKIGLEAPWAEVEELNKYLTSGTGQLRDILKDFRLYPYESEEFVELVEAVKEMNDSDSTQQVSFFGFDFQSPYKVLDNLINYSKSLGVSNVDSIRLLKSYYQQLDDAVFSHMFNPQDFKTINDLSRRIIDDFADTAINHNEAQVINKNIKHYECFLLLNNPEVTQWDGGTMSSIRDSLMAINIAENLFENDKIVILAHNAHIQKTQNPYSKSMGQFLTTKIGGAYKCLALTTSTGHYTAHNVKQQKIIATNPILSPDRTAFEYYFSKVQHPIFFLNTKSFAKGAYHPNPSHYRLLPFGFTQKQFIESNIFQDFDFIIHINDTHGNKYLYLN